MNYYKDINNNIIAYSDEQLNHPIVVAKLKELTAITAQEADDIRNPFSSKVQAKSNELYLEYDKANQLNIDYMATTFDTAKSTQDIIANNLAIGSVPDGFYFRDINNVDVAMTYVDLQGFGVAIQTRGLINFSKLQDLKAQVELVTTQADLDLIVW